MTNQEELMQVAHRRDLSTEQDPYVALNESQFVPFFQPLIHLHTGQLSGFEVLARWQHPKQGLVPPNIFIPIAERDGWIGAMMRQILQKAFVAISIVSDTLTLAVNISPLQLRDPSLPEQLCGIASKAGFSMSRLVVEVTESALIDDISGAARIVAELKAMGCKMALDDFGTGYSSLNHLQALPFDELKVDQSFVSSMIEKRESRKIVSAVVGLGQSLRLTTVAEGIETQEQAEMVLCLGCELGQGYFFGRPMPAENLAGFAFAQREKIVAKGLSNSKRIFAANWESSPSTRLAELEAIYDGALVGLAFIDRDMRYLNINKRLADMNGATVEAHFGSHISKMIPGFSSYKEQYIRRALNGEVLNDVEVYSPDSRKTRLYSFHPAFDEAGEVVGVSVSAVDITERKLAEEALTMKEAHFRTMVELSPQMFWVMDPQGRNLDVIPRWDKDTGMLRQRSSNFEWLDSVHPEDLQATVRAIAECRRTESVIDVEYRASDSTGNWRWKRSKGSPRYDLHGNLVCWYGVIQDIDAPSQLKDQKDQVAVSEEQPAFSQASKDKNAPPLSAEEERRNQALLDLEILDTQAEAEFNDLVILAAEICQAPIAQISLVTSERQWVKASVGNAVSETSISASFCARAMKEQGLLVVEDAAKDERFMQNPLVLGEPNIRFYAGVPLYAVGSVAIGALCVIDTVPRTLSPGQVKALTTLAQQVQTRLQLRAERLKLVMAASDNQMLTKELRVTREKLSDVNSRLQQLAATDTLTSLINRRAFEEKLAEACTDARLTNKSLSLLVLDIDDFKKWNDEFGRAAGDEALRHIGEVLRKTISAGHTAARIGDEKFAILLPETTRHRASLLANRIHAVLGLGTADLPAITVKTGCACLAPNIASWRDLLAEAEREMHQSSRMAKDKTASSEDRYVA